MIFFYYLPQISAHQVTPGLLAGRGLAGPLKDCLGERVFGDRVSRHNVVRGPDGSSGVILFAPPFGGGEIDRPGYHPEHQEWTQVLGADGVSYWLGRDREQPPSPEGLRREDQLDGYEQVLGDGRAWLCPTIRRAWVVPRVPQSYGRHNGRFERRVLPEYEDVWKQSAGWLAERLTDEEWFDASVTCLGLNYRLGAEEITALGLLNDRTMQAVMESALDEPWFREAQQDPKKKHFLEELQNALVSSSDGPADSPGSRTIGRVEPT